MIEKTFKNLGIDLTSFIFINILIFKSILYFLYCLNPHI